MAVPLSIRTSDHEACASSVPPASGGAAGAVSLHTSTDDPERPMKIGPVAPITR